MNDLSKILLDRASKQWKSEKFENEIIPDFVHFATSVAWYDDEYALWNLHEENEEVEKHFKDCDQFRFTTKELFIYFSNNVYECT